MLTFGHFIQNLYTQNFYNVSVTKINPIFFWLHIYQLSMPISWSFYTTKNLTYMIGRWRHFCYNINLTLLPKKACQALMNI